MGDDWNGGSDDQSARRAFSPRLVVGLVLAAALAAFIVQNTRSTPVEWLVFEFRQPLWVVLLITAGTTLVVAELLGAARRRRKRRG